MDQATIKPPQTIDEVKKMPHWSYQRNHAAALVKAAEILIGDDGPLVSKKIFFDTKANAGVYEYYRVRNKALKVYIIL